MEGGGGLNSVCLRGNPLLKRGGSSKGNRLGSADTTFNLAHKNRTTADKELCGKDKQKSVTKEGNQK